MKKKIGEITLREISKICEQNTSVEDCNKCPFCKYCGDVFAILPIIENDLNQEIEVKEDEI